MRARWKRVPRRRRWLTVVVAVLALVFCASAIGVTSDGPLFWYPCSLNDLEPAGQGHASILYSAGGKRIGTIGASRTRLPVPYGRISPAMRQAMVAAEDRRFWGNDGIDVRGIVRALATDVTSGGAAQGGSTITQQLVRNLYLGDQRTISRKLTEACLAVELDRRRSKRWILTEYLNQVYFGHRAYGVEAAALAFFDVHAKDLTVPQAALLAGMPQAPSAYDPFENPGLARQRRAVVLAAMLDTGAIGERTYRRALASPLGLRPAQGVIGPRGAPYLENTISAELVSRYGAERVRRGGLRVYTTLDAAMQRAAERAISTTLNRQGDPAGALVSIDPQTGRVRALAVAQTGKRLAFDVAADGHRQAGSTFKSFVLADAVEHGIDPYSTDYLSAPFSGPDNWQVSTYEHTYSGRIPLSQATILSDNTVFARLTLDLGPASVATTAQKMGIESKLRPVPSIGLGANPITPLELTDAYATLASGGVHHAPELLRRVVFADGTAHSVQPSGGKRVLDPKVAAEVTKVLVDNVRSGTGTAAALPGRPAAGKTGTTSNYADAWFAGYVPGLTTAVWVGYPDRERPMTDVHGIAVVGASFPAEIWHAFMESATRGLPVEGFPDPGAPPFERWCGRYQFAASAADARPHNGCSTPSSPARTTQRRGATTSSFQATTTAPPTTQPRQTTTAPPTTTTTAPPPPPSTTTTAPPPPSTTEPAAPPPPPPTTTTTTEPPPPPTTTAPPPSTTEPPPTTTAPPPPTTPTTTAATTTP